MAPISENNKPEIIIKTVKLTDMKPAAYNPRKNLKPGDPDYENLKRSILKFGYVDPIIWNKRSGNIVGGHQRWKIMKQLGRTELDVSVVDLNDDDERAFNLMLNKAVGTWEPDALNDVLAELMQHKYDMDDTGFSTAELDALFPKEADDDSFDVGAAVAEIKTPVTKTGDVWQLGKHRLLCGDATSTTDVEKLMGGTRRHDSHGPAV